MLFLHMPRVMQQTIKQENIKKKSTAVSQQHF